MVTVPAIDEKQYNKHKWGYAGELGRGANVVIKFIQTGLELEDLDSVELIENIPGSEKWNVKDLFQRTVDTERVGRSILPYLKDETKVKFFNPLTLTILPFETKIAAVEKELHHVVPFEYEQEGVAQKYEAWEVLGRFRYLMHPSEPAFSRVEWNDKRVRVVAIDGQHRLSALKRWKNDPEHGINMAGWTIPVVILSMFQVDPAKSTPNVLEVVRNTFVYINTQAREINESRRILLDDESINCICAQEVVQHAHENDQREPADRDDSRVPLMFYDWRGEVRFGRPNPGPASLKSVQELQNWFEQYLLGEDGSNEQELALGLLDMIPPINDFNKDKKLTHDESRRIRDQFRIHVLPGFNHLLQNFTPYSNYIRETRALQRSLSHHDLAVHAFHKICFGSHRAGPELYKSIENQFDEIVEDLTRIKEDLIPPTLAFDIGMRGVMYAFQILKTLRENMISETLPWSSHSEWFVNGLNAVYDEGWFEGYNDLSSQMRLLLTHVIFDSAGQIINYKWNEVADGLGPLLAALIAKHVDPPLLAAAWEELAASLKRPLRKGFRRETSSELRPTFEGTHGQFQAEVKKIAETRTDQRLEEFFVFLNS